MQDAVTKLQAHPGMGRAGRVPGTRALVLHKNHIAIYRVRGDDV
ncbi:MAG: type II toxin-antitoxin system RelE/ParE family toxin, partial [Betaproteobacteria bacterium]